MSNTQTAIVIFVALASGCVGVLLPFVSKRSALMFGLVAACLAFVGLVGLVAAVTVMISPAQ